MLVCAEPGRPVALPRVDDCPAAGLPCAEVEVGAPIPLEDWPLEPCAEMLPDEAVSERNASLPLVDEEVGDCDCVCNEPLALVERFCEALAPDWLL